MTHLEDSQLRATIATIPWWTVQDVQAFCRISKSGLEDLVQRGKLRRVRGLGKERLFCREEVLALLAEHCTSIVDERRGKRG